MSAAVEVIATVGTKSGGFASREAPAPSRGNSDDGGNTSG
jgi:hypothetical protein